MKGTYRYQKQCENKRLRKDTSSKALEVFSEPSLVAAGSGVKKVGDEAKVPQVRITGNTLTEVSLTPKSYTLSTQLTRGRQLAPERAAWTPAGLSRGTLRRGESYLPRGSYSHQPPMHRHAVQILVT